jgi:DNA-binding CsgD family transcriptional regulator
MGVFIADVGWVSASLPEVIRRLGENSFGPALLAHLNDRCGAEYCSIYEQTGDELVHFACIGIGETTVTRSQIGLYARGGYWQRDEGLHMARASLAGGWPGIARISTSEIADAELRLMYKPTRICDRALLVSGGPRLVVLSVLRSAARGPFLPKQFKTLRTEAEVLMALIGKHMEHVRLSAGLGAELGSLCRIEERIKPARPDLTRREMQICARILYGLTTIGIALDLGIGEESVITYRKRAYRRLEIGTARELLLWYLSLSYQMPA